MDGMHPYVLRTAQTNMNFARTGRDAQTALFRAVGAKEIFLALTAGSMRGPGRARELEVLRENCAYLHAAGFTVGAWLWAFYITDAAPYTMMTGPDGRRSPVTVCPTDEAYRADMGRFLQDIAAAGADMIMFDDDLRCGFQDMGFGCACENHRRKIGARLGREISPEDLRAALLTGGKNEIRSAFIRENGRALEEFCAEMRRYVDETAPEVRMGFCACITSWDLDGTAPDRLSRLLAGRTRPFYRLIGAPYWGAMNAWGHRPGDVIELERAEAARREAPEAEIFSEGDTFPRPRFSTPAAYLEAFDQALRAAGCTDGILKYMFDYTADVDYEPGYAEAHIRNQGLYQEIDRLFSDKVCAGVRVWDNPRKYETLEIPPHMEGKTDVQEIAFSAASRFLTANSLPGVYEGPGGCSIAFGEDARTLPPEAFANGLILDAAAAKILAGRGVDTGITAFGERFKPAREIFTADGNELGFGGEPHACALTLNPGARVLSEAPAPDGGRLPLSYTYENAAGQRFLVYAWESVFSSQSWMRCYLRARQAYDFAAAAGEGLPAFCPGNPDLYLLVKRGGNRTAVGLWNLFADAIETPRIVFPGPVRVTAAVNCEAKAEGNTVTLTRIGAFSCALLEAESLQTRAAGLKKV